MAPLSHANAAFLSQPSAYLTTTANKQMAADTTLSKPPLESIASHLLPSFQYPESPAATRILSHVIFVTPCWHGEPTAGRPYEYTTTSLLIGRNAEDFASQGLFSVPHGVAGRLSPSQLSHILEEAGGPNTWSTNHRLQNLDANTYQMIEITPGGPYLHVVRFDRDPTYQTIDYVDALAFVAAAYPALRTPLRAAVIGVADDPAWASLPPPSGQLATYLQETTTKSLHAISQALMSVNAVYDDSAGHPSLYLLADKSDVSTMTRLVGQHVKAGTLDRASERLYCTAVARRMDRYLSTFGQLEPELLHLEWGRAQKGGSECLSAVYSPPSGPEVRMDIGVDATLFNSLRQMDDTANPANIKKRIIEAIREETRPVRRDSRLTSSPHCSECDVVLRELWEAQNPDAPLPEGMVAAELHHVVTVAELYHTYCEPVPDPSALLRPPPNHYQFKPSIPRDSIRAVLQDPANTTWLCHNCHLEVTQLETARQHAEECDRVLNEDGGDTEQPGFPRPAGTRKSSAEMGFPLTSRVEAAANASLPPPSPSHATAWWTVVALGQANGFIPVIRSPSRPDVVVPPQESPSLSSYVNALPPLPNALTPQAVAMAALVVASYLAGCRSASVPFPSPLPSPPSSPTPPSDDDEPEDPKASPGGAGGTPPDDAPAGAPALTPYTPAGASYEAYVSTPRPVIPTSLDDPADAQIHLDAMKAYCDQCLKQIHEEKVVAYDEKEAARVRHVKAAQVADAALDAQRLRAEAAELSLASSTHLYSDLQATLVSLQTEHATLHVEIATIQGKYDQSAAALASARQDVAAQSEALSSAKSNISTLERQCARLQGARNQLEDALDKATRSSVSRALTVVDDTELADLRDTNAAKDVAISKLMEETAHLKAALGSGGPMTSATLREILESGDQPIASDTVHDLRARLSIVKLAYRTTLQELDQAGAHLDRLQAETMQSQQEQERALADQCDAHHLALQSLKDEQASVQANLDSQLKENGILLHRLHLCETSAPPPPPPPLPPGGFTFLPPKEPTKDDAILAAIAALTERISAAERIGGLGRVAAIEPSPDPKSGPALVSSTLPGSHPRPVPLASIPAATLRPILNDECSVVSGEGGAALEEALAFFNLTPEEQIAQLPPTVDRAHILGVLHARADSTASRWRRRQLFVKDVVIRRAGVLDQGTNYVHRMASSALKSITDLSFDARLGDKDSNVQARAWSGLRSRFINAFHDVLVTGCDFAVVLRKLMEASNVDLPNSRGNRRVHSYAKLALDESLHRLHPVLCADAFIFKLDTSYRTDHYGSDSVDANWNALNSRHVDDDCDTLAEAVISAYIEKLNSDAWNSTNIWTEPHHVDTVNAKYAECLLCDLADISRGDENYARFMDSWKQTQTDVDAGKLPRSDLSCAVIAFKFIRSKEATKVPADLLTRRSALMATKESESKAQGRGASGRHAGAVQLSPPQTPPPPPPVIANVTPPIGAMAKGLGKGLGKGSYKGGRGNGTPPPPASAVPPPPPPPPPQTAGGYAYPPPNQLTSSSRNVAHPAGSTGNPRKVGSEAAPWTNETWKSTILDFTYLHSCSPTSAGDALRHCWPADASFSATSPVRPKSNDGVWAVDSCLYCFHRPKADPSDAAAAVDHPENWWYGTGQGNHNPYRCKAFKRYLAEGGDLATHPQFAVNLRGCLRVDPVADKK
jgi:hypothetical protein